MTLKIPSGSAIRYIILLAASVGFLSASIFLVPDLPFMALSEGNPEGLLPLLTESALPLIISACAMAVVLSIGAIDFSMGAVSAMAAAVFVHVIPFFPMLAAPVALLFALSAGLINGLLAHRLKEGKWVGTLFLMVGGRGLALSIAGSEVAVISDVWSLSGGRYWLIEWVPTAVLLFYLALYLFFFRQSRLGSLYCNTGRESSAMRHTGFHVSWIQASAFLISAFSAGVAGIVFALNSGIADSLHTGRFLAFDSLLAALVGGAGLRGGRLYPFSVALAAFLLSLVESYFRLRLYTEGFILLFKVGVVLLLFLIFYLMRRRGADGRG